jgi:hypothetical protein
MIVYDFAGSGFAPFSEARCAATHLKAGTCPQGVASHYLRQLRKHTKAYYHLPLKLWPGLTEFEACIIM